MSPLGLHEPRASADVGARIRSLRTAKGLTQAQVAEPQYTKAYISMLESGRTRASMKARSDGTSSPAGLLSSERCGVGRHVFL